MQQSFEGIRAMGEYVIAEHCGVESKMAGGLVAPDSSATDIWRVISVGAANKTGVQVGERVGFRNATQLVNNLKKYAVIEPKELLFALPFVEAPKEEPKLIQVARGLVQ